MLTLSIELIKMAIKVEMSSGGIPAKDYSASAIKIHSSNKIRNLSWISRVWNLKKQYGGQH